MRSSVSLQGFLHRYKPIDAQFCDALPSVRFVTGGGAGYDNIDTGALSSRGVYYCNTPQAVATPTADSASVLILAVLKNVIYADRNVRKGRWGTDVPFGLNPKGATLGIWGMGSIGRITSKQMQAFGMKVVYHNRNRLPKERKSAAAGGHHIIILTSVAVEGRGGNEKADLETVVDPQRKEERHTSRDSRTS